MLLIFYFPQRSSSLEFIAAHVLAFFKIKVLPGLTLKTVHSVQTIFFLGSQKKQRFCSYTAISNCIYPQSRWSVYSTVCLFLEQQSPPPSGPGPPHSRGF
jgi:hypothetical protein